MALLAGLFVLAITITAMRGLQSEAGIRDRAASGQSLIPAPTPQHDRDPVALLDAYRHVEVASVSDAIEQLLGKRMYLSHRMQPLSSSRFAGYALTVRTEKQENHDAHAVDGMLEAIDRGEKNSVYVMSVEDGADVAGMGGLMGTAMAAREFSGAVIDAAVRDTAYLRKIGFPVYSTGVASLDFGRTLQMCRNAAGRGHGRCNDLSGRPDYCGYRWSSDRAARSSCRYS